MFPAIIFATTLGLYINSIAPDIFLTLALLVALGFSTYKTGLKIKDYIEDQK